MLDQFTAKLKYPPPKEGYLMSHETPEFDLSKITRFEVIDEQGRAYVRYDVGEVEVLIQDGEKTLKVFINPNYEGKVEPVHMPWSDVKVGDVYVAPFEKKFHIAEIKNRTKNYATIVWQEPVGQSKVDLADYAYIIQKNDKPEKK